MSSQETKHHILKTGRQLILQKGYINTGLNEILEQSGIPKGSFYHYFDSKEDFGLQVIDFYERDSRDDLLHCLQDTTRTPLERLKAYYERSIARLASLQFSCGCLLGDVGQEMSSQNDQFRLRIDRALDAQVSDIAQCLSEAQAAGEIRSDTDVQALAEFCLNSWQGAILRMKVVKSPEPLQQFLQVMFDIFLCS